MKKKFETNPTRRTGAAAAVLAGLASVLAVSLFGMVVRDVGLFPRSAAGQIGVAAPAFHFLTGASLDRLHDGAVAPFDFELSIAARSKTNVVRKSFERFVISYDLWEEKFAVTRVSVPRLAVSHLTAKEAEGWCLNNLGISPASISSQDAVWLRLEVRSGDPRPASELLTESPISLTSLIELFSRPAEPKHQKWVMETGPFRLADLKR
ncbi:MAG TPA: hypothetical protein VN610_01440 [Bryobacteraceae bacterium]|nr:hypothetical protein [Bryobacteraceae bacterium]